MNLDYKRVTTENRTELDKNDEKENEEIRSYFDISEMLNKKKLYHKQTIRADLIKKYCNLKQLKYYTLGIGTIEVPVISVPQPACWNFHLYLFPKVSLPHLIFFDLFLHRNSVDT